jgi:AhpD family alkylhydroperoxidase
MLQGRMKNPAMFVPGSVPAIRALISATQGVGIPAKVMHLAHLRASQINGCGFCVDIGTKHAKHFGEKQLAGLVLWIALVNFFNRANVATRQPAGQPLPD